MAKRKRLGPARGLVDPAPEAEELSAQDMDQPEGLETKSMFPRYPLGVAQHRPKPAPIAAVAGRSASDAALEELAETLRSAREEGRLIQALPLDAIEAEHLVRDRLSADEEEMQALLASLRTRGQQTPIEVMPLEGGRFGLISGWRRLTALRRLAEEGQGGTVLAILRNPDTAAEAYCAMVEENEIRVDLSYYERARIVARAAQMGVYPDTKRALQGLFASASRAKRSKIGSFVRLHDALDDVLRFPGAIPERLGLALVKAIEADEGVAERLRTQLVETGAGEPEAELGLLASLLDGEEPPTTAAKRDETPASEPVPTPAASRPRDNGTGWVETIAGVRVDLHNEKITLTGQGMPLLAQDLAEWLRGRS